MQREPDEVVGVVNIGATTTDIIIESEQVLKFRRSAPVAGNEVTMSLHNELGRSFEECEDLKVRFGRLSTGTESRFGADLPPEWAGTISEDQLVSTQYHLGITDDSGIIPDLYLIEDEFSGSFVANRGTAQTFVATGINNQSSQFLSARF